MTEQQKQSQKELEQLVDLAEIVFERILTLKRKHVYTICMICLCVFGCLLSIILVWTGEKLRSDYEHMFFLFEIIASIALLIATLFLFYDQIFKKRFNFKDIKQNLKREKSTLQSLFTLIHSYRELLDKDLSIVSKTIIDIRISRIDFFIDDKETTKATSKKNTQTSSTKQKIEDTEESNLYNSVNFE